MSHREFKFRAWDKERKIMIGTSYPTNWGNDKDEWYTDIHRMDLIGIESISQKERFNVMQYTGLKDKNGKEIFEGDLVKISHITNKWNPVTATISFINFHWSCSDGKGKSLYNYITIPDLEFEIIGNIYENICSN